MLTVTSISGNVFHDKGYAPPEEGDYERLRVPRSDLGKKRMRRRTDRGTDVALALEAGQSLRHGDVLSGGGRTIVVEQLPEKVISVRLKTSEASHMVLVGHVIGNRHRPFSARGDVVSFPIQARTELEVFGRLFSEIAGHVELSTEEVVFTPHAGADVHGHG